MSNKYFQHAGVQHAEGASVISNLQPTNMQKPSMSPMPKKTVSNVSVPMRAKKGNLAKSQKGGC